MKAGKIILYILIAILVLGGGAYIIYQNQQETERKTSIIARENKTVLVRVTTARYEMVSQKFKANGTLQPKQKMMLSAEIGGQVVQIFVEKGDHVNTGQTLAKINEKSLRVKYSMAKANYQNARQTYQRLQDAFKTGGVTEQKLDQARLRMKTAKDKMKQAKIRLNDSNVKTLISGVVSQRNVEPGTMVAPGTPMFQIVNVSELKLKVTVDEIEVTQLEVGDRVKIKVSVFPEKTFQGKITYIAPVANASLSYPVEITLKNKDESQLRAGMYATAIFEEHGKKAKRKVMTIPEKAFVGGISNQQVFVVQKDSTVNLAKVVPGRIFGDKVVVLDGLKKGAQVVVSGQINLSDGAEVSIVE